MAALERWNPACSFKTKIRLSRNLRMLQQAFRDKEQDRLRLMNSVVADRTKTQSAEGTIPLNLDEMAKLQEEYRALMGNQVDVDIHPVPLFDSSDETSGQKSDPGIDLSTIAIPNDVLTALLDVVFTAAE